MAQPAWLAPPAPAAAVSPGSRSLEVVPEMALALEAQLSRILAQEGAALRRVAASYEADAGRAEDLFQDICLALWQALPRFRGEASERTFAFRIAHNRGLAALARRRRVGENVTGGEDVAALDHLPDPAPGPESRADRRQRGERLYAAVRGLPLALRQVLTLALEGLTNREIGDVLGISEGNAAVRLTRARKALKTALAEDGGERR